MRSRRWRSCSLVGVVVGVPVTFLVARVYDAVTERDGVAALDRPLLDAAIALRSPPLDGFAAGVAYLFGPVGMPAMAVLAIVLLALIRRSWTPVILVAAAGIGSLLMTIAGKDIIGRHRPALADAMPPFEYSPSFPSGHTLNATVDRRRRRLPDLAAPPDHRGEGRRRRRPGRDRGRVGLTRVLLGAHWFTDVARRLAARRRLARGHHHRAPALPDRPQRGAPAQPPDGLRAPGTARPRSEPGGPPGKLAAR